MHAVSPPSDSPQAGYQGRPANEEHPGYKEQRHWLATPRFFAMRVSKVGPLASVGSIHRSAEGSLPAFWALAGSQAHRTPAISKMSGRFTNMSFPLNQSVRRFHKLCGPTRSEERRVGKEC